MIFCASKVFFLKDEHAYGFEGIKNMSNVQKYANAVQGKQSTITIIAKLTTVIYRCAICDSLNSKPHSTSDYVGG